MEAWRSELYHHGILGMKWGVRRYQNYDGTLTRKGLARYREGEEEYNRSKADFKAARKAKDVKAARDAYTRMKLSKDKMNDSYNRLKGYQKKDEEEKALTYVDNLYSNPKRVRNNILATLGVGALTVGSYAAVSKLGEKYTDDVAKRNVAKIATVATIGLGSNWLIKHMNPEMKKLR